MNKQESINHDTYATREIADAARIIRAGVNNNDNLTQAIGVSRLISAVGTDIPESMATSIGLDKVETLDD